MFQEESMNFVRDVTTGLYLPPHHSGDLRNMDIPAFRAANISTDLDRKAYVPIVGLGYAVAQFAYGWFELYKGCISLDKERLYDGMRDIFRGGIQSMPVVGFWAMGLYDIQSGYLQSKISRYDALIRGEGLGQERVTQLRV